MGGAGFPLTWIVGSQLAALPGWARAASSATRRILLIALLMLLALGLVMNRPSAAWASTYVVYIPLDDPIYNELSTLNGLGYLDTYLSEIKPISRIEAARLTLEAQRQVDDKPNPLASSMVSELRAELSVEVGWLEHHQADDLPTMIHPVQRLEAQYVYSQGAHRTWQASPENAPSTTTKINAEEGTPLLPNNDGLPTSQGSNEIARWQGWGGVGSFLTMYAEGAVAGPLGHEPYGPPDGPSRFNLLGGETVVGLGNFAVSFGQEEMWWGTGHFGALDFSNNAPPFPALRVQLLHPVILPGFLRYLGQFRFQAFFGELDPYRYYAQSWIDGEIFAFKPLPNFEFGLSHAIIFGGRHNDNYTFSGFLGRATGFATGSTANGNTHSQGGIYLKFYFPRLRNAQLYQQITGDDNLSFEIPGIGRFLPFLSVSYQGGFYIPRLTSDGKTDLRFEYVITEPNYSTHGSDTLYFNYRNMVLGDAIGPNATQVDIQLGHWLDLRRKLSADIFYTEEAPNIGNNTYYPPEYYPYALTKEHSGGLAVDLLELPAPLTGFGQILAGWHLQAAIEGVQALNYQQGAVSVRALLSISGTFEPSANHLAWSW